MHGAVAHVLCTCDLSMLLAEAVLLVSARVRSSAPAAGMPERARGGEHSERPGTSAGFSPKPLAKVAGDSLVVIVLETAPDPHIRDRSHLHRLAVLRVPESKCDCLCSSQTNNV